MILPNVVSDIGGVKVGKGFYRRASVSYDCA